MRKGPSKPPCRWRFQTKSYLSIEELSERINPVIRGWINYYGHFRRFEMYTVLSQLNKALVEWVRNKYKKRRGHTKAGKWLEALARREPHLFVHWTMGIFYAAG